MTIKKITAAVSSAILLIFAGCSNLDDTTDLGAGFVKNQSNFDVKEYTGIIDTIVSFGSFQDATDSMTPAVFINNDLSTGRFANFRTVSYIEFNNDTLLKLYQDIMNEIGGNNLAFNEISLKINIDTTKSSSKSAYLEAGTSYLHNHLDKFNENDPANDAIAYANTSQFLDTSTTVSFYFSPYYFFSETLNDTLSFDSGSDTVININPKDLNVSLITSGTQITKTISSEDSLKTIKTLESMDIYDTISESAIFYSYGPDAFKTLSFDTTYTIQNDTDTVATIIDTTPLIKQTIKYKIYNIDTTTISLNEAFDYFVANEALSTVWGNIKYSLSDTIKSTIDTIISSDNLDTLFLSYDSLFFDTIFFEPKEVIASYDVSPIVKQDGSVEYDTNSLAIYNFKDIKVVRICNISEKEEGILEKLNNEDYWFTTNENYTNRFFSFYIKQLSDIENSLQFYNNPRIEINYSIYDTSDNLISNNTKTLLPSYRNYTIFEDEESTIDSKPIVAGASNRMLRLKLDLSKLWKEMRDTTDTLNDEIIFQNVPHMEVSLKLDSAIYHKPSSARKSDSTDYFTYFQYRVDASAISTIWDPSLNDGKGGQISRSKSDTLWLDDINEKTDTTASFEIDYYIQQILNEYGNNVPDEAYLTIWLYDNSFNEVIFDTTSYEMDFIISNLKEGDE